MNMTNKFTFTYSRTIPHKVKIHRFSQKNTLVIGNTSLAIISLVEHREEQDHGTGGVTMTPRFESRMAVKQVIIVGVTSIKIPWFFLCGLLDMRHQVT
jgi:hypothetical protein